jgi:hypothetical protein
MCWVSSGYGHHLHAGQLCLELLSNIFCFVSSWSCSTQYIICMGHIWQGHCTILHTTRECKNNAPPFVLNLENKFEHFHWWYGLNSDILVKNWWRLVIKALECRPFRMTKPVSKRVHFWELVEWFQYLFPIFEPHLLMSLVGHWQYYKFITVLCKFLLGLFIGCSAFPRFIV